MMKVKPIATERGIDDLPEELVINIMARLPPQSLVRLKLVCREWKSLTESAYLRDLYHSNFSSNSSSNWSILHGDLKHKWPHSCFEELELDLPSPHGHSSFARSVFTNKTGDISVASCTDGLFLLCFRQVHEEETRVRLMVRYYVGNPVLPQWLQLPPPPSPHVPYDSGLVTRMHNGALLGYKVVRSHHEPFKSHDPQTLSFEVFSSDTGEWSVKQVSCPGIGVSIRKASAYYPVSLDGKLHWLDNSRRVIIVHNFFSNDDDDQVRAISLPNRMQGTQWYPYCKMICTTSQGYYVIVDVELIEKVNSYSVRVWRLKCDDDSWKWEKAWEMNMSCLGLASNCVPMAINCFDIDIIYLWDLDCKCFIACNLRENTKSYGTRKDGVLHKNRHRTLFQTMEDVVVYKEDAFCCEPYPCVLHYVPSLQVIPH
ncbi:unnamed protein product [Microthlaspi erraticum]|uniref:F-box domain-containing protein n=1 Tax=Microthlaspi erraticum TaxID=1685480 RepID=A0A6D2K1N4_9BRAS|nr:unnamed protein product [Microthlaspi erraticum]